MPRRGTIRLPFALGLIAVLLVTAGTGAAGSLAGPAPDADPAAPDADPGDLGHDPYQTDTSGYIQPGAAVSAVDSPSWSYCTLNFVVSDGETFYVGTAGHCFETGTEVVVRGAEIGHVVATHVTGIGGVDWAFIEVDEAYEDEVNPSVRQWNGPVKAPVPLAGDAARTAHPHPGEPLFYYGQGGNGGRVGATVAWTPSRFVFAGEIEGGDSGGPILNAKGQAVGIVSATAGNLNYGTNFQTALNGLETELGQELWLVPGEPFLVGGEVCRDCPVDVPEPPGSEALEADATPRPATPDR